MTSPTAVEASIAAQNTFTDALSLGPGESCSVSISGSFSGTTVTVQHKLDGENWRDVASYTAAVETIYDAGSGVDVRVGVKTGNYSSGPAVCRLAKG